MRTWIKSPLAIFNDDQFDAANGIVIDSQIIDEHIPAGARPALPVDQVFDASEHVVLPGLINTHHHYYQNLTRATAAGLNKKLFPWLESLYPIWAGLTEEMVNLSTQLACAEMMLSGCTTSVDHHYLFTENSENAIDAEVEAVKRSGIRAVVTRGSMSLGQSHGELPPDQTVQDEDIILNDCERVIGRFHDPKVGSMLQIALAPCSPFSVSKELMINTAEMARKHKVRLHTHLAETEDETNYCLEKFNCRPLAYLEEVNWLADDVWLAHGIFFNDDEISKLGNSSVGISHCPSSNMVLASGTCPVVDLQNSGCAVGIGIDGSASNDCSNMIQEVRQAFLLQRLKYGAEQISHNRVLNMATSGSAKCLGRHDIGTLAIGSQADLALFRLDEPRFSGFGDPLAALVICGAVSVDQLMIAGQWKVKDKILVGTDLPSLMARHHQFARNLQNFG